MLCRARNARAAGITLLPEGTLVTGWGGAPSTPHAGRAGVSAACVTVHKHSRGNVIIWNIGKKGYEHFTKNNYKADDRYKDIFLHLGFDQVQDAAQAAVKAFQNREFDAVEVVYSEFRNAATQSFVVEQFLPIPKTQNKAHAVKADFIFDPNKEELIAELMPKILNTQLYKAVLDAWASEHGARMTAMDKASENANELLRNLKISYNRARQAAITTELTEIVSGAAALQG